MISSCYFVGLASVYRKEFTFAVSGYTYLRQICRYINAQIWNVAMKRCKQMNLNLVLVLIKMKIFCFLL